MAFTIICPMDLWGAKLHANDCLIQKLFTEKTFKSRITLMRSFPKLFALFLIGLFLAFSFNAYACVVPIYTNMPVTQVSDCTMPGEEPVTQFCDGFKTLAVQSSLDTPSNSQAHAPFIGEMALLFPDLVPSRNLIFPPGTGHVAVPKDLLLLISVFRI